MEGKTLKFGGMTREPDVRMLKDMEAVIWDQKWLETADNFPLYFMYRDLRLEQHREVIGEHDVRYDITVIPPNRLGPEYVKTKGHYHPEAADGVSYPEIYEVIQGTGHFLMQKREDGSITDVIVVEGGAGDKIVIPPNYGHITINPGAGPLKMANWVSSRFESIYGDIEEKQGGAYYETVHDEFKQNDSYDEVPELRWMRPAPVPEFGITPDRPMYRMIEDPENLRILNTPERFDWVFEKALQETSDPR
ncbi:MAG: glucose-6-phosphate isomerase family protein [Candidatus Nanohaloarchaea archaeon]|nr:glucose-6-phosphate isomerase family protein [Candidatus Nanohaloarchaea archaeon]